MNNIPTREQLLNPVLEALVQLGGSGTNDEINDKVISNLQIPEDLANVTLPMKEIASVEIPIPSLDEQKKIMGLNAQRFYNL